MYWWNKCRNRIWVWSNLGNTVWGAEVQANQFRLDCLLPLCSIPLLSLFPPILSQLLIATGNYKWPKESRADCHPIIHLHQLTVFPQNVNTSLVLILFPTDRVPSKCGEEREDKCRAILKVFSLIFRENKSLCSTSIPQYKSDIIWKEESGKECKYNKE